MKKKLLHFTIIIALLATGYALYALHTIRGLGIYLIKTSWGGMLAATWQPALLVALILWLPAVIYGIYRIRRWIRSRSPLAEPEFETVSATQTTKEVLEPRPAAQDTELIEPSRPAGSTEFAAPEEAAFAEETELVTPGKAALAEETELVTPGKAALAEETELVTPEEPALAEEQAEARFCAFCGRPVTGRFCARCGARVK
ncbi:hypothetical protein OBV_34180 [Oscillibacter valericigenes Sjm18-20]|nr:hypothetical protein OBV_34180 [Oscillibacter valericigenes Sjm18-20]